MKKKVFCILKDYMDYGGGNSEKNMNNLENKYDMMVFWYGFFFTFVFGLLLFYGGYILFSGIRITLINFLFAVIGFALLGTLIGAAFMYTLKLKTIKTNFSDKKDFLDKIDVILHKLGFHKRYERANLKTYFYTFRMIRINIKLDKNSATISGPIDHIEKLEKIMVWERKKYENKN